MVNSTNMLWRLDSSHVVEEDPNVVVDHNINVIRHDKSCEVILLYLVLLGPQMECCAQFWALCFEKDVAKLGQVQKSVKNDQRSREMKA